MDQKSKCQTWNLETTRGRIRETLQDLDIGNDCLNVILISEKIRAIIGKWNGIKLKSFCKGEQAITILKKHHTEWKKNHCLLFVWQANNTQNIQNTQKIKYQKVHIPIGKWANELNR
jgi:hypothetical protein